MSAQGLSQPGSGGNSSVRNCVAKGSAVNPNHNAPSGDSRNTRRTMSGDETDTSVDVNSGDLSSEFAYTVHIPPTPDNQPASPPPVAGKVGQQFASSTLFKGGFNAATRGHVMQKLSSNSSNNSDSQMVAARQMSCQVDGCDGKAMKYERGEEEINPCECDFRICRDCYLDVLAASGRCPGCREAYRDSDNPEHDHHRNQHESLNERRALPAPMMSRDDDNSIKGEGRLFFLDANKDPKAMLQEEGDSFDHARWLYETKGTYGYGNAVWPKDDSYTDDGGNEAAAAAAPDFSDGARRPLTRKVEIPPGVLSPYRFFALLRFVALGFFLTWRVQNPNRDAMWLWGMSVICEFWFAFAWILEMLPKLCPVNRQTNLLVLKDRFESITPENPRGSSDLPGIDVFVSTVDPEMEPPLVTANTILSILAADYSVEKLACYLSDDGGALLTFEALAECASFARVWVPFCRKHNIEPRNPETYFQMRGDPTKGKLRPDFVKDRRKLKREYDEFKVRINALPDSIRRRSDAYNAHEEIKAKRKQIESGFDLSEPLKIPKATWMADGTHWPGVWAIPDKEHSRGDHAGLIQVMLAPPRTESTMGSAAEENVIDTTDIDIRLPMLVYVSRERRPGYDHNKKAGAMNALARTSAIMSNGAFILNLDCDNYIFNSMALREAMCFMVGRGGDRICYVQFPQRFQSLDPRDRSANRNTVFFDVNMRALDGLQGPVYVGTGCVFRRIALYGFDPPGNPRERSCCAGCWGESRKLKKKRELEGLTSHGDGSDDDTQSEARRLLPKQFGSSTSFISSISVAEFQGRPLAEHGVRNGRPAGALTVPREPLDAATVSEAISVISCFYEDKTEWGQRLGWIYGSVTEDVVTGYRMHNRGWRSIYCVTKPDAFRGTVPINLTDRLHQMLRWATGSVEIFFSTNSALFANSHMKALQRVAYLNVGVYPFTSIFLAVYCLLPALSLFSGQFIVHSLDITFLAYLLIISISICGLAILEIKWSEITLEEWWRNEQFWVMGGTSAHLFAVLQGLLQVIAGLDISLTFTSKSGGEDEDDLYADFYKVEYTGLIIPPITIMLVNVIAIGVAVSRTLYSTIPQWSKLVGGTVFSMLVLAHLYPFAKSLMGTRGRRPTVVFVWAGLLAIVISLLWVTISPPTDNSGLSGQGFQFP